MSKKFEGKVVVATGTATGLGRATAELFAAEGAALVLVDLNGEALKETADLLTRSGAKVRAIVGDVSDPAVSRNAVGTAVDAFGRLDVLFNNAAIDPWSATSLEETPEALWSQVMDVNLKSAYMFTRAAIPEMRRMGGGSIVNTASTAGIKASPRESVYGISKAALIQLTKSVARDHAGESIRSNCICPGFLESVMSDRSKDMTQQLLATRRERASGLVPMRREGRYDEVAKAVLFLADPVESSYITGAALVIDGGFTLV
jgi:NAD(P)-dependent dehydrogenase (short-subunit alcohol dehydrogenase family)